MLGWQWEDGEIEEDLTPSFDNLICFLIWYVIISTHLWLILWFLCHLVPADECGELLLCMKGVKLELFLMRKIENKNVQSSTQPETALSVKVHISTTWQVLSRVSYFWFCLSGQCSGKGPFPGSLVDSTACCLILYQLLVSHFIRRLGLNPALHRYIHTHTIRKTSAQTHQSHTLAYIQALIADFKLQQTTVL